jgi:molecular chaperone GrpE (heat shock protein)
MAKNTKPQAPQEDPEVTVDAEDVGDAISELKTAIERRTEAGDALSQKAFDQLYEELRQYKEDFIFQAEKPLLLDLLLFYDSVNWFQQSLIKKEMSPDVIADSFQYIIDELLEVLYRRDVLPMEAADQFSRETQKVIKTVPAQAKSEDYEVAQVLKRGFTRGGRVLRAEEVVVKRFQQKRVSED